MTEDCEICKNKNIREMKTNSQRWFLTFVMCVIFNITKISKCEVTFIETSSVLTDFDDFRCPPNFNTSDCLDTVISTFLNRFRPRQTPHDLKYAENKNVGLVLNQILNMFENSHALVILTNYGVAEITEISHPIILRKLRLAWLWKMSHGWSLSRIVYVQEEVLRRKINLTGQSRNNHFSWNRSPFWTESEDKNLFSYLNVSIFSMKTLPWSNLVSIFISPHIQLFNLLSDRNCFKDIISNKLTHNILPSVIPPIKILLPHPSENYTNEQLTEFISSTISTAKVYIRFILIRLTSEHFKFIGTVYQASIQNPYIIQLCRRNAEVYLNFVASDDSLNEIIHLNKFSKILSSGICQGSPALNNLLFSIRFSDSSQVKVIEPLGKALQICHTSTETDAQKNILEINPVAESYARVWLSLMGNFSYNEVYTRWLCDNGKMVEVNDKLNRERLYIRLSIKPTMLQYEASGTLYPAVVSSIFNDLRFVTCGYQSLEKFPFEQLLVAFDKNVWIALIICTFCVAIVIRKIPGVASQLVSEDVSFVLTKLFLEQGNPFPNFLVTNHRTNSIVATLLLTGITLSNAYKNTNVYNMIIPRRSPPYKFLQELVTDNFTIYTKSHQTKGIIYLNWWLGKNDTPDSLRVISSERHFEKYRLRLDADNYAGDIISHSSEVQDLFQAGNHSGMPDANNNLRKLLLKSTSLIPISASFLKSVIQKYDEAKIFPELSETEYIQNFLQAELDQLLGFLRECKKTALVLSSQIGSEFVKMLEKEGRDKIYQGEETYYEVNVAFNMEGIIPPYLIQRAKYAEKCGLWKRWRNLFKKNFLRKSDQKTEPLRKPTMDGNVVIIFILLFAGMVLSLFGFAVENSLLAPNSFRFCK